MNNMDIAKREIFKRLGILDDDSLRHSKTYLLDELMGISLGYHFKIYDGKVYDTQINEDLFNLKDQHYLDGYELQQKVEDGIKKVNAMEGLHIDLQDKDPTIPLNQMYSFLAAIVYMYNKNRYKYRIELLEDVCSDVAKGVDSKYVEELIIYLENYNYISF